MIWGYVYKHIHQNTGRTRSAGMRGIEDLDRIGKLSKYIRSRNLEKRVRAPRNFSFTVTCELEHCQTRVNRERLGVSLLLGLEFFVLSRHS